MITTKTATKNAQAQKVLSAIRQSFVDNFVKSVQEGKPNATQAAKDAGYSQHTADKQSSRLLKQVEVRTAVDRQLVKFQEIKTDDATKVRESLAEIAYGKSLDGDKYTHGTASRLRALEMLGKAEAMFSERHIVTTETPKLTVDEVTRLRLQSATLDNVTRLPPPTVDVYAEPGKPEEDTG